MGITHQSDAEEYRTGSKSTPGLYSQEKMLKTQKKTVKSLHQLK